MVDYITAFAVNLFRYRQSPARRVFVIPEGSGIRAGCPIKCVPPAQGHGVPGFLSAHAPTLPSSL
jgi:hypothetical protein